MDTLHVRPVTFYKRYGGLAQTSPLTEEEQKYDDTCRAIDQLETEIGAKSMALFTANEFMWFNHFVSKMWVFPKQEQLDRQLSALRELLTALEAREPR
jgi:hypothetical protein